MENLTKATSLAIATGFRAFLRECEGMGIEFTGKGQSVGLAWFEPNSGARFTFGSVYANGGWIEVKWIPQYFEKAGLDMSIAERYIDALATLVPGARVEKDRHGDKEYMKIMRDGYAITLGDILPSAWDWLRALENVVAETEAAMAARASAQ